MTDGLTYDRLDSEQIESRECQMSLAKQSTPLALEENDKEEEKIHHMEVRASHGTAGQSKKETKKAQETL